ncbi:MAG: RNA polymerase sigma factor [Phycisphaerales bacterium JB043]
MDDIRKLTQAIIAGDRDACARFYDKTFDLVHDTAYKATGFNEHDTLDIVQDTYLKAIRHMKRFDSQPVLQAWLVRVTKSVCIDAYRKRARRLARELRHERPEPTTREGDSIEWLHAELSSLDRLSAELLSLRYRTGLTLAAIGDRVGLSTGAVDGRINRALKKLRERAGAQEADDA